MYIPGHVAVAYLAGRAVEARTPLDRASVTPGLYCCVVLGALFPDLIDKPRMYLGLTVYGRTLGHSLVAFAVVGLVWVGLRLARRRGARAFGWFLGGWATHFGADVVDDLVAGVWHSGRVWSLWFLGPWWDADDLYLRVEPVLGWGWSGYSVLEVGVVAVAVVMAHRKE